MDKDIQQKYIEMIETSNTKGPMIKILKGFVNSFDGDLTLEFHKLVMGVLVSSMQVEEMAVKAEAYDDLEKMRKEQADHLEELAEQGLASDDMINIPIPT